MLYMKNFHQHAESPLSSFASKLKFTIWKVDTPISETDFYLSIHTTILQIVLQKILFKDHTEVNGKKRCFSMQIITFSPTHLKKKTLCLQIKFDFCVCEKGSMHLFWEQFEISKTNPMCSHIGYIKHWSLHMFKKKCVVAFASHKIDGCSL